MLGLGLNIGKKKILSSSYSSQAQALFDTIGSVPEIVKPIHDALITTIVNAGQWDNLKRCLLCIANDDHDNYFIDIKTLTKIANFENAGSTWVSPVFGGNDNRAGAKGYQFTINGYVDTGYIPNDLQGATSMAEVLVMYDDLTGNGFTAGAIDGTGSTLFSPLFAGKTWGDSYNTTVGQGRIEDLTATGNAGVYIKNRRSNTDAEVWENTTQAATSATSGGAQPLIASYLNCYNSAGSPSSRDSRSPICAYGLFESGLSAPDLVIIRDAFITWQNAMEMKVGTHTRQIVLDGNSHTELYWSKMMRRVEVGNIVNGWEFKNFGVQGQTTPQMIADYASEVAPKYNGSYTDNVLIVIEGTNDLAGTVISVQDVKDNIKDYCDLGQATGYRVLVSQLMLRKGSNNLGLSQTDYYKAQDEINIWLSANYTTFADELVEVPTDTYLTQGILSDGDYLTACNALTEDTAVFIDATHLVEDKYSEWANNISAKI